MKDKLVTRYETTSSYGRMIKTIPNIEADHKFINDLTKNLFELDKKAPKNLGHTTVDQQKFVDWVQEALVMSLSSIGLCNLFADNKDHMQRPIPRYIVTDPDRHYNYIVDVTSELDVSLVMNPVKRFWMCHLPRSFVKLDYSKFVPRIKYQIRIWNSPISYYLLEPEEVNLNVEYSSRIEVMRDAIGFPDYYDAKDHKLYGRLDYYIRRAIFNEGVDVLKG